MDKRIAIVGAGVGGLATAARLACRGYNVQVFEKLPKCGGRAHIIEDRGFKFDTGPSFVLMPDFFQEVFAYCHENINDYLNLQVLDVNYKIFYQDGQILTIFRDSEKTKQELEKIEKGSGNAYDEFLSQTGIIYKDVKPLLYSCFTKQDLINPRYWGLVKRLKVGQSYWQIAKRFFKSDKLCYAFTFEAMFIGVSPFKTPGFYSIITYVDHVQKIYHPMGGMYKIPQALEKLAKNYNAQILYDSQIKSVRYDRNKFVLKTADDSFGADKVIINADYSYAQNELLGRKIPQYDYSCSVYLIYLGLKQKVGGLAHHNLFFANDLEKNLREIFIDKIIPQDPSFYIHLPTVTDPSLAPEGKDILYILIPVPNLFKIKQNISESEERIRRVVFERINSCLSIKLEDLIEVEHRFYPQDFISRYNIKYGATFGLAHTFFQSAFFRPYNFDNKIKNLYFVGASTQPGGGLPPVIASSRIVADLITGIRSP